MLSEFAQPPDTMVLHPGSSFGPFQLGWDVVTCVKELRREDRRLGKWVVGGDVGGQRPVGAPISIQIPRMQTVLHFHPMVQRLERIVVSGVEAFHGGELRYRGRVLCGPRHAPTFTRVIDVLGPTFQGSIEAHSGVYCLHYPGLTVCFAIPRAFIDLYAGDHSEHPMTLPDGTSPMATTLMVEPASAAQFAARLRGPVSGLVLGADSIAVDPKKGVRFTRSGVSITFGMAPQEVICLLGGPETLYAKQDDRLLIHNPTLNKRTGGPTTPSYFLTFPLLGVDVMFDGVTHRAIKIICFNGIPPHETFLRYLRAHFVVDHGGLRVDGNTNFVEEVKPHLARCPQPLLHSHNGVPMRIYCFRGLIYYVLGNGLIASVMVFEAPAPIPASQPVRQQSDLPCTPPLRREDSANASTSSAPPEPSTDPEPAVRAAPSAIDDTQHMDPLFQFLAQPLTVPPSGAADRYSGRNPIGRPATGTQSELRDEGVSPVSADDERSGAESLLRPRGGDSDFGTPILRNIRHGFDALLRPPSSPDNRGPHDADREARGPRSLHLGEGLLPDLWETTPTQSEETAVFTSPNRFRSEPPSASVPTVRSPPRVSGGWTSESVGADESGSRSGASGWDSVAQSGDDPTLQPSTQTSAAGKRKKSKKNRT